MEKKQLVRFTKILLDISFYVGILICLLLPWIFKLLGKYAAAYRTYYVPMCLICLGAGIATLWIIKQLRFMFQTVADENCFIRKNVTCLKKMGLASFVITALFMLSLFFQISMAMLVIIIVFIVAGLFSLVLAQVFDQAVKYKEENDLTI